MTYEWEDGLKVLSKTLDIEILEDQLPKKLKIVGLVIAHDENIEACVLELPESKQFTSIAGADIWKDVAGDAERIYGQKVKSMR